MHNPMHRRHRHLPGIVSLLDLASRAPMPDRARPPCPASPRMRRDIGLPALEFDPFPCTHLHRKS